MTAQPKRRPVTVRVASWSATHPWRAIAAWFVFVVLCLGTGSLVGTNSATSADYRVGEAGRAEAIAAEGRLGRPPTERVLIESPSGPVNALTADRAVRDLTSRMRALPEVDRVEPPVRSEDGKLVMVAIVMKGEELAAKRHIGPLVEQTAAVQAANPGLRITETGRPSMSQGLDAQRADDLFLSEMITLPVTLAVLLLVFGSVLAAGVPLLLALSSIAASMGLAAVASHALPDAGVGNSVILLIGMAVGVDYSLFYLKREREERARAGGRVSPSAVVELAAATSGRAIVVSGLAVIVSTACLYLATDVIFSSLATGTIIAVLVAMVSSLTVLPAILAKAGDRVDHRRARRAVRPASERQGTGRADEIRAAGGRVDHQELDVTNLDSVRAFTETAHDRLGRIDVLVNNAGVMPLSRVDALRIDEWNQMIDVNLRGTLHGIAAVLPHMRSRGAGHIVNVASTSAHRVDPTAAVYCATKYAVLALSEGLRQESRDIRVTVVSPGFTRSELADRGGDPEVQAAVRATAEQLAIPASAVADAIGYAIAQPDNVDVNELIVRPTVQG